MLFIIANHGLSSAWDIPVLLFFTDGLECIAKETLLNNNNKNDP